MKTPALTCYATRRLLLLFFNFLLLLYSADRGRADANGLILCPEEQLQDLSGGPEPDERQLGVQLLAPVGLEWTMERALSVGGPWVPYYSSWYEFGGNQYFVWKRSPLRTSYQSVTPRSWPRTPLKEVTMLVQVHTDGMCYARWLSVTGSGPVWTYISPPEIELRSPDLLQETPCGIGWGSALAAAGPVPYYVTIIASPVVTTTLPAAMTLAAADEAVRAALISVAPGMREQLWPETPLVYVPPVPPSYETRGYYRVRDAKRLTGTNDVNGNTVPDNFEAAWDQPGTANDFLIISEVGAANTQVHEVPATPAAGTKLVPASNDWVELMNANSTPLTMTAANTFTVTDTTTNKGKWVVPAGTIPSGGRVVLSAPDLLLPDKGTTLYVYRRTGTAPSYTYSAVPLNTLTPPPLSAFPGRAPADYSYGLRMLGTGTGAASYVKGFMLNPTPGALNYGYTVSGVTGEPAIVDADSTTVPRAALGGRLFRSGEIKAEVVPPDAQCLVTYTLDGTEPDARSEVYSEPLTIRGTCTLRVRAYGADRLPSQILTRTFVHTPAALAAWYLPEEGRKVATAFGLTAAPPREALAGATCILDQFEKVPSLFITWPPYQLGEDLTQEPYQSPGTGADGVPHYRAAFEYYDPACPADYRQENCLIQDSPEEDHEPACDKHTWDIFFASAVTIGGQDRWTGPVTTAGGVTCSKVFPGSKVTSWPGLLLRSMGRNSFQFCLPGNNNQGGEPIDAETYMSDAWMRYLQELAATMPMPPEVAPRSDVVPQRRFVQLWLNGRYHGVYDLNEPPTRDTISAHLLSRLPANATQAQRDALKPSLIEFLSPCASSQSPNAEALWNTEVKNVCAIAKQTPNGTTYASATAHLDMESYVRHCSILEYLYPSETQCSYRAWRHPGDQKWRFISWEADDCTFGYFDIWNRSRYLSANVATFDPAIQPHNLQPLYYLKTIPGFQAGFSAHLSLIVPALFGQQAANNRWLTEAQKFRDVLESEGMRWGGLGALDQWSVTEPYFASLTFARGIEHYRRLMANKDLVRWSTTYETNSLYNMLTVAASQGLYTGDATEYDTPYSTP